MTNIIAIKDIANKYRVIMDSSVEKAPFVHISDKIVRFKQLNNNLYGLDPRDKSNYMSKEEYKEKNIQIMNVVQDNLENISERYQKRVKAARKAFQAI